MCHGSERVKSDFMNLVYYMVHFFGKKRTFEFLFLAVHVGSELPVDSQRAYAPVTGKKDRC